MVRTLLFVVVYVGPNFERHCYALGEFTYVTLKTSTTKSSLVPIFGGRGWDHGRGPEAICETYRGWRAFCTSSEALKPKPLNLKP